MDIKPLYWFDYKSLYVSLDKDRQEKGISWNELAREIGVTTATVKRTRIGGPMEADGIRAMVAWLGLSPEHFVRSRSLNKNRPKVQDDVLLQGQVRRFDKRALYAKLNDRRQALGLSWSQLAKEIGGVSPQMLKNLVKGSRISADLMVATCGWLGESVENLTYISYK